MAVRQWPSLAKQVRAAPDDVALGARVFFAMGGHDEGGIHPVEPYRALHLEEMFPNVSKDAS